MLLGFAPGSPQTAGVFPKRGGERGRGREREREIEREREREKERECVKIATGDIC